MQRISQAWLVLELTDSGTEMALVSALQFVPIWFVGPIGGMMADRLDRKRLLYFTNSAACALALSLGLLVVTNRIEIWMVYAFALLLGVVEAFDNPARQAFINDLVGQKRLGNAIAINMVLVNIARVFGPALAGLLIVNVGIGVCFLLDAATYAVMIVALFLMSTKRTRTLEAGGTRRVRDGFGYSMAEPRLRVAVMMLMAFSALAYQFEVIVPLLVKYTFGGNADLLGMMFAFMGVGAVGGGIYCAARRTKSDLTLSNLSLAAAFAIAFTGVAPSFAVATVGLVLVGAITTAFLVESHSAIQLAAPSHLLGRILGVQAIAVVGVRPIFAPLLGWVGEVTNARLPFHIGAFSALIIGLVARRYLVRMTPAEQIAAR